METSPTDDQLADLVTCVLCRRQVPAELARPLTLPDGRIGYRCDRCSERMV